MALKGLEKYTAFAAGVAKSPDRLVTAIDKELADFAPMVDAQLLETFDRQQDPYGNAWPKRKVARPWPILNRTGALRRSIESRSRTGGIVDVASTSAVAAAHQRGTRTLPQRQILPDDRRGLPKALVAPLNRRVNDAVRLSLGLDRSAMKK